MVKANTNWPKETRNERRTPGIFLLWFPGPVRPRSVSKRIKTYQNVMDTTNDHEFIVHEQNFFL